ncbi:Helical region found in SNAREs [Orobanche hederae]
MNDHRRSHLNKTTKQGSVDPGLPARHRSNPFDSDDELENKQRLMSSKKTSDPPLAMGEVISNFLMTIVIVEARLKIAEDMREGATKTLITLHQQIVVAADIDHDLSRSEKLFGSLGGIFPRTWKPKTTREIVGPLVMRDDPVQRKGNHLEEREKLGLSSRHTERTNSRTPPSEPTNALQKVELEKSKQDYTRSDLSKDMAIDMGQKSKGLHYKLLKPIEDDVEELNF